MLLKFKFSFKNVFVSGVIYVGLLLTVDGIAQTTLPLTDLSSFKSPGKSWKIAGNVIADLDKANIFSITDGPGILVNLPSDHNNGTDLFTNSDHGDIDLELDYIMAKGSNSGVYLQGRYEIQLHDSWSKIDSRPGDNGGIYERWDESRPEGQKGYDGYAPRQNVSKAPGLWQHLKVSFQAPRFDAQGNSLSFISTLVVIIFFIRHFL